MKALSIKQPWAWLICAGYKDIENRNWRIRQQSRMGMRAFPAGFYDLLPCRIYVHASKQSDRNASEYFRDWLNISVPTNLPIGTLVGEVDIVACVTESDSPWFTGKYGFVLANPQLYNKSIPCKGKLGFFEPDIGVMSFGVNLTEGK